MTGRRPDTLQLYDFYNYWRDSVGNFTTLPQYLKDQGYETHSIGKVFHSGVSSNFTDDYPYSWTNVPYHSTAERYMNKPVCWDPASKTLKQNIVCPVNVEHQPLQTLPDIQSINEAKKFLKKRRITKDSPFFLAVGLHKPHIPLRFPERFLQYHSIEKFADPPFDHIPVDMPLVAFNPYTDIRRRFDARIQNISFPFGPVPREFGMRIRQAYYSTVTYVDDLVGRLLKQINFDDTVVVLTSDHGWSLGEHGEWAKYSNFDIALRVPLIISSPQHKSRMHNTQITSIVEMIDIFPTILELANVPAIGKCMNNVDTVCAEGKSLVPLLTVDRDSNSMIAVSQYPRPTSNPSHRPNSDKPKLKQIHIMGYSMRVDDYRYTIWIKFNHFNFQRGR